MVFGLALHRVAPCRASRAAPQIAPLAACLALTSPAGYAFQLALSIRYSCQLCEIGSYCQCLNRLIEIAVKLLCKRIFHAVAQFVIQQ